MAKTASPAVPARMSTAASALPVLMAAAFVAAQAPSAAADRIGAVAAVNSRIDGTPPSADPRSLILGDRLFLNEQIESSPIGSGQFLFLDQSSLTVAPNSNLVLDRYIYDPDTRTGEFSMSMSRGVLRFIGGRISKTTDAVVTTPTATIGIRGGIAIVTVLDDVTRAMLVAGDYVKLTSNTGEEIVISRANGVAEVSVNGVITYLGVADQELIRATTLALIGRGDAGERVRPQNPDVIESDLPAANSEKKGAPNQEPISTTGESENEFAEEEGFIARDDESITTVIADASSETLITPPVEPPVTPPVEPPVTPPVEPPVTPPVEPPVTPPVEPPVTPPVGPVLLDGVTGGASIGSTAFIFDQVFAGSRIGVTADGDRFVIPTAPGFFSFEFADGVSPQGPIEGGGFFDPTGEFTYAAFETQSGDPGAFLSGAISGPLVNPVGDAVMTRAYTISADLLTGDAAFAPGSGLLFSSDGFSDLALVSNRGDAAMGDAATGGAARAVATFLQIDGAGAGQTSGFGVFTANVDAAAKGTPAFSGAYEGSIYAGAGPIRLVTPIATVEDGAGGSAFGPDAQHFALSNSSDIGGESTSPGRAIASDGTTTSFTTHNVASRYAVDSLTMADRMTLPASTLKGYAATAGLDLGTGLGFVGNSTGEFGVAMSFSPSTNSVTTDLSLDNFIDGEGSQTSPQLFDLFVQFGGEDGKSVMIDDRRYGARDATGGQNSANFQTSVGGDPNEFRGALASAELAGDGGIFPAGVTPRSEYLTWGWWAGEVRADPESALIACQNECSPITNDQRFHLGAFVAGDLTSDISSLNGIATYDGFAVVSAIVDGANVVDGAGFNMEFDFGQRDGSANFTDLLGSNVSMDVGPGDGTAFSGDGVQGTTIMGRPGSVSMRGDFFNGPGGDAAQAAAGSLDVRTRDNSIIGAGIFAGDRVPAGSAGN